MGSPIPRWKPSRASSALVAPTSRMRGCATRAARSASLMKCGGFTPMVPCSHSPRVFRTSTSWPVRAPSGQRPRVTRDMAPLAWMAFTMPPTSSPCASSMTRGRLPCIPLGVIRASRREFSSTSAQPWQKSRTTATVSSSKPEGDFAFERRSSRPITSSLLKFISYLLLEVGTGLGLRGHVWRSGAGFELWGYA